MKNLRVSRLDYKNFTGNGYHSLPLLKSLDDITDINEVSSITIEFDNENDSIEFANKFPKSYKASISKVWNSGEFINGGYPNQYYTYHVVFYFNTFFMNGNTGNVNETAVKTRIKVINKLNSIG